MNGMDDFDDEHNFSDGDLDGIPDDQLLELERNAIQSTQQPRTATHGGHQTANAEEPARPVPGGGGQGDNGRNQYGKPPLETRAQLQNTGVAEESFDTAMLDDDGTTTPAEEKEIFIPPNIPSEMTRREQWRQDRFGRPAPQESAWAQPTRPPVNQTHLQHPHPVRQDGHNQTHNQVPGVRPSGSSQHAQSLEKSSLVQPQNDGLRAKLETLLRERDELAKELDITKGAVMTQQGEISIIRANQQNESKIHDRQINALKKSLQDETTKHKTSVQMLRLETETIATANKFLHQDLAEEATKNKALQRALKDKQDIEKAGPSRISPQKTHAHSLRDGFDDEEIMMVSPVKLGRRSKTSTPTTANKRKRKVEVRSPMPSLVLRQSAEVANGPVQEKPKTPPKAERVVPVMNRDDTAERNLKFIQRILNHRISGRKDRIIEAFMQFSFPSDTSRTLTTIILESTACVSGPRLPAKVLEVFIQLWSRALHAKYYKCISLLAEVINFIIALESSVIDAETVKVLVPVLQASGQINAAARFNHSPVARHTFGQFRQTPQSQLNKDVNGTVCLEMLYTIACTCADDDDLIKTFWKTLSTDFVLVMLNSSQPIADITLMLCCLLTSILSETFGNVCNLASEQPTMETYILDRLTYLLWEKPRPDQDVPAYSKSEICYLRLEAMSVLTQLVASPNPSSPSHGSTLFASHPTAIARLVRSIHDELDTLYTHPPSHSLHAELINHAIHLLHSLLTQHSDRVDVPQKISAINGGVHKHRVALTRIAFSEGLFLDVGITDETVLMATEMLEEAVTPEEAELLVQAFPTYGERRSTQG